MLSLSRSKAALCSSRATLRSSACQATAKGTPPTKTSCSSSGSATRPSGCSCGCWRSRACGWQSPAGCGVFAVAVGCRREECRGDDNAAGRKVSMDVLSTPPVRAVPLSPPGAGGSSSGSTAAAAATSCGSTGGTEDAGDAAAAAVLVPGCTVAPGLVPSSAVRVTPAMAAISVTAASLAAGGAVSVALPVVTASVETADPDAAVADTGASLSIGAAAAVSMPTA